MGHLVIYESWLQGHGQVLPGLLTELGHSWTFVTRNPDHYLLPSGPHPIIVGAEAVERVETNSVTDALPVVERLLKGRADAVFTVCDYYINQVAELCVRLDLPSAFCPAVTTARNKALTRQRLDEAGLANAAHLLTGNLQTALQFARSVGYPIVCKPADLAASVLVRRVDNEEELRKAFTAITSFHQNFRGQRRAPAVLLEEWLEGAEFSVEAITRSGHTTILGITDKVVTHAPYFIEVGHQFPALLEEADQKSIYEYVTGCLAAIEFREGVSHTEVKLTQSGPKLVEINPRPGNNYIVDLVCLVTGIDQLEMQLAAAFGHPYAPRPVGKLATSAASAMLIPNRKGTVTSVAGLAKARATPGLQRLELFAQPPFEVSEPEDNGCYLGMLLVTDPTGLNAGRLAQSAAGEIIFMTEPNSVAV